MVKSKNLVWALTGVSGLVLTLMLVLGFSSVQAEALVATGIEVSPKADAVQVGFGSRYVEDGTYVIDVGKKSELVVGVANSSTKAGAKAVMVEDGGTKSQQWVLSWDDNRQAYRIRNANSGYYLTTKKAKAGKELVSQAKFSENSKKQLWKLEKDGTGYKIISLANSSVGLGTANGKAESGFKATVQKVKARKFKFYLLPVDENLMKHGGTVPSGVNGQFVNISKSSKQSLRIGINSDDMTAGASVALLESASLQSQKWYFKAISESEGIYAIINLGSGKALQVAGKGRHIGTGVTQGTVKASSKYQQWWVRCNAKGEYTFTSRYNGLSLRTASAKVGVNASLGMNDSSNRKFKLGSTDPLENGCYQVSTWKNTALAWDLANGTSKENAQLKVKTSKKALLQQEYLLVNVGGSNYEIRSVTSNRYIGEVNGRVVQGTRTKSASQRWRVSWDESGFVLKNAQTGHYLCVSGSVKNGATLIASTSYQAAASKTLFTRCHLIENGTYFIAQGSNAKKVMGIAKENAKKNKASVEVVKKANVQNYKFDISYIGVDSAGNEIYKIKNTYSGKFLTASGTGVSQMKKSSSSKQRWTAIVTPAGMIAFKNVATGKAMHIGSKKVKTGTYSSNAYSNFRLNLLSTTSLTPGQLRAYDMVASTFSRTNYALTIDLTNHRLRIWKRKNENAPWTLRNDWICSNGKPSTPTGTCNWLSTGHRLRVNKPQTSDGHVYTTSFYYLTYLSSGQYIHTPVYKLGSTTKIVDGRMGRSISNGCVRLQVPNAIWVYKHIKRGTRMIAYY